MNVIFRDTFINQNEWSETLEYNKYPNTIEKQISNERNKTFLKRFGNYMGAVLLVIIFIWISLQAEGIGLIIILILGFSILTYILSNFKSAIFSIFDRIKKIPRNDLNTLIKLYYKEREDQAGISDFGPAYSCLSPYTVRKINFKEFIQASEHAQEKIYETIRNKLMHRFPSEYCRCEKCYKSDRLFKLRTATFFEEISKRAKYEYIECNQCGSIYCKECILEKDISNCECGDTFWNPPYIFFLREPYIEMVPLEYDYDKAVSIEIIEEDTPDPRIRRVLWKRSYKCKFVAPLDSYSYKEASRVGEDDKFICNKVTVTLENYAIFVDKQWYLISPTLGDAVEFY